MEPDTEFDGMAGPEITIDPDDEEIDQIWRRYDSAQARFERQARGQERKARRDLYQREMGLRLSDLHSPALPPPVAEQARNRDEDVPKCDLSLESGERLPSLLTLEKLAAATDLEVVIGLRDPEDRDCDLLALGIVFDEANCTELLMLIDKNDDELRVTPWRLRLVRENARYADLLL